MKNTNQTSSVFTFADETPSYFAAANTGNGFTDFFKEIFDRPEIEKIYILKGGPGVGKSTLMKKAALAASEKGLHPKIYYCSSDPSSLDGVIIEETGHAILDGTSPHIFDPVYPGTRDIIVNLGEAWNLKKLAESADKIKELTLAKSSSYKTAYRFLAAAKKADEEMCCIGERCMDKQKANAAAMRFAEKYIQKPTSRFAPSKEKSCKISIYNAISCKGAVRLFTPEAMAEKLFFVKDVKRTAGFFMKQLYTLAQRSGTTAEIGINPLNPDGVLSIYLPESKTCISIFDDKYCEMLEKNGITYKVINLGRFFNAEKYKQVKNKYRFSEKCRDSLLSGAYSELARAGEYHAELEKIYGDCTDYRLISKISDKIIDSATEA